MAGHSQSLCPTPSAALQATLCAPIRSKKGPGPISQLCFRGLPEPRQRVQVTPAHITCFPRQCYALTALTNGGSQATRSPGDGLSVSVKGREQQQAGKGSGQSRAHTRSRPGSPRRGRAVRAGRSHTAAGISSRGRALLLSLSCKVRVATPRPYCYCEDEGTSGLCRGAGHKVCAQ